MASRHETPGFGALLGRAARWAGRTNDAERPSADPTQAEVPSCPACDRPMRLRVARRGGHVGRTHWCCTAFPGCRGLRELG